MHQHRRWRRWLAGVAFTFALVCAVWPFWLAVGAYCCCLPVAATGIAQLVVLIDCMTAKSARVPLGAGDHARLPWHLRWATEADFVLALVGVVLLLLAFWRVQRGI